MFLRSDTPIHSAPLSRIALILVAAISLLAGAAAGAKGASGPLTEEPREADALFVPTEYGEVVFQKNGHCPRQIFIIGQSHRSAVTGLSGPDTLKVQTEIYRIGEWLIREKNIGLLLPEGFFQRDPKGDVSLAAEVRENIGLDNQELEAELSDTRRFVNADMLLNTSYNVRLGQVEDERLYWHVSRLLNQARRESTLSILSALDNAQEERTAAMLQNIPEVVERTIREGRIGNRAAIFTIGMAHIGEIINALRRGSIHRPVAESGLAERERYETSLKLLDQGYGVTVIIPRTLAEDKEVLRMARVEID